MGADAHVIIYDNDILTKLLGKPQGGYTYEFLGKNLRVLYYGEPDYSPDCLICGDMWCESKDHWKMVQEIKKSPAYLAKWEVWT